MELKGDLSKVKVGDWVCTTRSGWTKVVLATGYVIRTTTEEDYYPNGKWLAKDEYPTCFPADQVPQPYLDLFGPPPCKFKDGDRVWVRNNNLEGKHPRIFKEYADAKYCVYGNYNDTCYWEYCAPWNNGVPPEGGKQK